MWNHHVSLENAPSLQESSRHCRKRNTKAFWPLTSSKPKISTFPGVQLMLGPLTVRHKPLVDLMASAKMSWSRQGMAWHLWWLLWFCECSSAIPWKMARHCGNCCFWVPSQFRVWNWSSECRLLWTNNTKFTNWQLSYVWANHAKNRSWDFMTSNRTENDTLYTPGQKCFSNCGFLGPSNHRKVGLKIGRIVVIPSLIF